MNSEIKKITDELRESIVKIFESGEYEKYLECMTKFHTYSLNNILWIYAQMPTATLVAGYRKWSDEFNRHVRKGESSIKILAPIFKKVKVEEEDGEKEVQRLVNFKVVSVFDISQTEGEELPTTPVKCVDLKGNIEDYNDMFAKLEKVSPVPIGFEDIKDGSHGYFNLIDNRIAIKEGMSQLQTIKTTIHEIAHSILHNMKNGEEKEADRHTAEVQAESVAYTVCKYMGLDTSDYSFGYITGWSKGKEAKELIDSMDAIRKTAKTIIEACA